MKPNKKISSFASFLAGIMTLSFMILGNTTANAQPAPYISGPFYLCPGQQGSYQIMNLPGGCTTFSWAVTGVAVIGYFNAGIIVQAGGPGYFSINATADCFGNTPPGAAGGTIGTPPTVPSITKSSTHYEVCSGESWTLTCNGAGGPSYGYDWYVSYDAAGGGGVLLNGGTYTATSLLHTTTNTVTLTALSGYGKFTVRARLNSQAAFSCPSIFGGLIGQAGIYNSSQFYPVGPTSLCQNSTASYSSSYYGSDITSTQWSWATSFNYQGGQGTNFLYVGTNNPWYGGAITLRLGNRCGLSNSPSVLTVGRGSCFRVASPNPVSSTIEVVMSEELSNEIQPAAAHAIVAKLVNMSNQVVWSGEMNSSSSKIDATSLPEGWYILKVTSGDHTTTERILVKH